MTLKQILYVRAVSKAGSIGKAAESLFISQSSLSESIRNLEREYGMVLFERTSKGISLTRQGIPEGYTAADKYLPGFG